MLRLAASTCAASVAALLFVGHGRAAAPLARGVEFVQEDPASEAFDAEFRRGFDAAVAGDLDAAERAFLACLELRPSHPATAYNLACVSSLRGAVGPALDWLERAIAWGWDDLAKVRTDTDLDRVRRDPRYAHCLRLLRRDAIASAESTVRVLRERLDERERIHAEAGLEWRTGDTFPADHVQFSSEGDRVLTQGANGIARLWDAWTGEHLALMGGHGALARARFDASGERILTLGLEDGRARLWEGYGGARLADLGARDDVVRVARFSPDGELVAIGDLRGGVSVVSALTGRRVRAFTGLGGEVCCVAFSPDGSGVFATSRSGEVAGWRARTGEELLRTVAGGHELDRIDVDPSLAWVLVSGRSGATLLDLPTHRQPFSAR